MPEDFGNQLTRSFFGDTNHLIPVIIQVQGRGAYMEAYNSHCMFIVPLPPGEWVMDLPSESEWLKNPEAPDADE